MVQEACTYVDQIDDMEQKLKLIDTLRTVTAGKIYVEIERARLTKIIASIKENQGNIDEAATILQELQVETYGSMEKNKHIYDTPQIKNNPVLMKEALKNIVIYLLLSPYDNEQQDLVHRLSEDKNLEQLPKY